MVADILESISPLKGQKDLREGSRLLGYLTPVSAPKKINDLNALEGRKQGTIPPSEALAQRNSDWSGWCGENMSRVYYFKRPLTKTQAGNYGLAYPAFRDGYYRPASAAAYDQFHPDARVAAHFIDSSIFEEKDKTNSV